MPVPRRRHCPSRQAKRRTFYKANPPRGTKCPSCGARCLPHRVCPACGAYRGRAYKVIVKSGGE